MPWVLCGSMVSTVRSLAWELVCIRVLSLTWGWRRFCVSSALVCCGSFFTLMTWCSSRTPRRIASPSSRHGRLEWKIKDSMSTRRRPSSWSLVMAMMSWINLASTPVISAVVLSAATPSCAHRVCCGSTRSAVTSLSNWLKTQTMSASDVGMTLWLKCVKTTFCYLGDMLCSGGVCDSGIAARCVAWGKFRKLFPALTTRQGVRGLLSLG